MSKHHLNNLPTLYIVSPGYNCANSIKLWYNSLRVQSYQNWQAFAIDDASEDEQVSEKLSVIAAKDNRVKHIHNYQHNYQLGNWYNTIHNLPDDAMVIRLDMDDFLGNKYIFENIIKEILYRDARVFTLTEFTLSHYYQNNNSQRWYGKTVNDLLKDDQFGDSLFAFRAKYFKNIPTSQFLEEGSESLNWIKAYGDVAITAPILYQGWNYKHHLFIDNGLMYNDVREDGLNDATKLPSSDSEYYKNLLLGRFRKLALEKTIEIEPL